MDLSKNTKEQIEFVRQQLISCEIPRDSLPYHEKFDLLYEQYSQSNLPDLSKNDYWRLLLTVGKKGNIKQQNKIKLHPIVVTKREKYEILRLLHHSAGTRDRLPYTPEFDHIYELFNIRTKKKPY
ncbi:MAG: hypothetical protein LBP59_05100 [Planctomycetaceae bacterium]|jgi:hypothetical protein|nr:hypothetical protein [Planctomycetaceae bacterium]